MNTFFFTCKVEAGNKGFYNLLIRAFSIKAALRRYVELKDKMLGGGGNYTLFDLKENHDICSIYFYSDGETHFYDHYILCGCNYNSPDWAYKLITGEIIEPLFDNSLN